MAREAKIGKLLEQLRGYAEVTNRRVPTGTACALWKPLRPSVLQAFTLRRRIDVFGPSTPYCPEPVFIKHLMLPKSATPGASTANPGR